jgi:hypothetical protein
MDTLLNASSFTVVSTLHGGKTQTPAFAQTGGVL